MSAVNSFALSDRSTAGHIAMSKKTFSNNAWAIAFADFSLMGINHTHRLNRQMTVKISVAPVNFPVCAVEST